MMHSTPSRSFTKPGELYIRHCNYEASLFPLHIHPSKWAACHDANEYTWSRDYSHDLAALSSLDRLKLSRSTGFCPHDRCQLGNITSAQHTGMCPEGLCFTKLENGGKSFGACCFSEGAFNSGQLLGYADKCINNPKPIYKHSRVVLGSTRSLGSIGNLGNIGNIGDVGGQVGGSDESASAFVNANQLLPGLIVTQCPMESTVADVQRMLVEQNVSLWVQLAPSASNQVGV
jgi:hypothetical protein